MKKLRINIKTLIASLLGLLCSVFLLCNVGLVKNSAQAFIESQGGTLGTLYNYNGFFNENTLTAIAKAAGSYNDINSLIEDITENDKTIVGGTFGDNTVYFGTNGNTGAKLEWTPVYVSTATVDGEKQAILTLWLAYCESTGSQEQSTWSDGTYHSGNVTQQFEGYNVYCNSYDGSYIRNYILNASSNYTTTWGMGTAVTPPELSEMNKFTEFISGELAQYIVTPSDVSWQMAEGTFMNDPNYFYTSGWGPNYPIEWTKDKLWLPSLGETGWDYGSIWQMSTGQRQCVNSMWLRTAYSYSCAYIWSGAGNGAYAYPNIDNVCAVRPALHLNLNAAMENSAGATIDPQDVSVEYNGSVQNAENADWFDGERMTLEYFSDADCTVSASPENAGNYYIKVTPIDGSDFYNDAAANEQGWKAVKFTITPAPLTAEITGLADTFAYGTAQTATVTLNGLKNNQTAELQVYCKLNSGAERLLTGNGYEYDLPATLGAGNYTLSVRLASEGNYTLTEVTQAFTITKKKITVTLSDSDGDGIPDTVTPDTGQIASGDTPPNFQIIYGTAVGSGTTNVPISAGEYYATVQISDVNSNYEIDTSSTYYEKFTVEEAVDPEEPDKPTDPTDPSDPSNPSGPTDPSDPSNPSGPTDPSDPSDPSNPSGPTDPSDPSNPSGPTDPSDPSNPTDPSDPSNPTDPSDPSNPTDPSDPSNPTDPSDPSDPSNPSGPTDPSDPSDPSNPSGPTDPSDPSNPSGPTDPSDPSDPSNPSGPTDPSDPSNPTDPSDPSDPNDSENDGDRGVDWLVVILIVLIFVEITLIILIILVIRNKDEEEYYDDDDDDEEEE